jgi:hypothetical protein
MQPVDAGSENYPRVRPVGRTDSADPIFFAPNRILGTVGLYGSDADANGLYRKCASMRVRWKTTSNGLAWFCGDDAHDRGIESETKVPSDGGKRWGTDQEEQRKTNLPDPYLDDLNGGWRTGFKKDEFPDFAVGSANGHALKYAVIYYTSNIINRGETNEGDVVVRVQSTRRPGGEDGGLERGYCLIKGQNRASHCYFMKRTCLVGRPPLRTPRLVRYIRNLAVEGDERC